MPLQKLLEGRVFDDEAVATMGAAYHCALASLGIKDRSDPLTWMIAETVIDMFDDGVRDGELICAQTVAKFRAG